jgi:HlyD family secretion protein
VRRIEPYGFTKVSALGVEEQRVNVLIDITSPLAAWARLGHGFRVKARVIVWAASDVLQVPIGALFRDGDDWAVFVAEDGRARLRTVTLGRRNAVSAQVADGLAPGDLIILHPGDRVVDGVRIESRAL